MKALVLAIALLQFQGPTGQRIDVNPEEVTSVREPPKGKLLAERVLCVIGLTNGKFIALGNGCDEVRRKLEGRGVGPCTLVCAGSR